MCVFDNLQYEDSEQHLQEEGEGESMRDWETLEMDAAMT